MTGPNVEITEQVTHVVVEIAEQGGVDLTVEHVVTAVDVEIAVPGIQGPPGERGPAGPGGGSYHVHDQPTPALVWTIGHELGRRPAAVAVEDVDGHEIDAGVHCPDDQTVIITLGAATAGRAHLS
ncbi:hypothetical protein [Nonomuraea sp. NPDC003214]